MAGSRHDSGGCSGAASAIPERAPFLAEERHAVKYVFLLARKKSCCHHRACGEAAHRGIGMAGSRHDSGGCSGAASAIPERAPFLAEERHAVKYVFLLGRKNPAVITGSSR